MIKYLGSKRRLVPVLTELFERSGARSALDLFTGTTRVAQAFKAAGGEVTAVDTARYSEVFARTWIETDADAVDRRHLAAVIDELDALPGAPGYVTETFCERSRFFQPHNGERIDAIRTAIADHHAGSPLEPILLTSLLVAADRVDSTTGVQMAYVKQWAPRSHQRMTLRPPDLLPGAGRAIRGDAIDVASALEHVDFAYLDPPYNQHRYFTNYHVWETLVAWDQPEHYGVACKRVDARDDATKSAFNRKREMPDALRRAIASVNAEVVVVSYNDESWVSLDELRSMCAVHGDVVALAFDSKRYVGAQIGIHDPSGRKVGEVSHTRNLEYVLVAGDRAHISTMVEPYASALV
ncbi:MAG: DNA adenine methylase [Ilumatobacter sp.]|uniref:DNA adenine methylase n=1 Tax=Ilumatobacter sp. TaxID=1967498 RepID=UPI00260EC4D7|nr:DNA adenine methylase [Ilumatobacter sp.]MDJ0768386.1 DNA adenine methylase [Ilumatobacter sp.]